MALSDYEIVYERLTGQVRQRKYLTRVFKVPRASLSSVASDHAIGTVYSTEYSLWVTGTNYAVGDVVISPTDSKYYKARNALSPSSTDPQADTTNWYETAQLFDALILREYQIDRVFPGQPGYARIICKYDSPHYKELLEETAGRALVFVDLSSFSERVKQISTTILEGEESDASGDYEWRVIKGDNSIPRPKCVIRVVATASSFLPSQVYDLVGKVNSGSFLGIAAGKLLFLGAKAQKAVKSGELWQVEYYWAYNSTSWNETIYRLKFVKRIREIPVVDNDNAATGDARFLAVADSRGNSESAVAIYDTADFSTLSINTEW